MRRATAPLPEAINSCIGVPSTRRSTIHDARIRYVADRRAVSASHDVDDRVLRVGDPGTEKGVDRRDRSGRKTRSSPCHSGSHWHEPRARAIDPDEVAALPDIGSGG